MRAFCLFLSLFLLAFSYSARFPFSLAFSLSLSLSLSLSCCVVGAPRLSSLCAFACALRRCLLLVARGSARLFVFVCWFLLVFVCLFFIYLFVCSCGCLFVDDMGGGAVVAGR